MHVLEGIDILGTIPVRGEGGRSRGGKGRNAKHGLISEVLRCACVEGRGVHILGISRLHLWVTLPSG